MVDVAMTLIGVLIDAVRYYFSRRAAANLRKEAELMLYALFNRDAKLEPRYADGNIVGIIVGAVGRA